MKLLLPTCCLLSTVLSACVAVPDIDIQSRLDTLDFDLDSASYLVRPGETLEIIAFRYNMSIEDLKQLNPELEGAVFPGMDLRVRQRSAVLANRDATSNVRNFSPARSEAVQVAPVQTSQAVAIDDNALANLNTDQVSLRSETANTRDGRSRSGIVYPDIVHVIPRANTANAQYPLEEEVILDENFQLPEQMIQGVAEPQARWVGGWSWPIDGQLARDYDPGRINGGGIEIVGAPGQNIYATRDGAVNWAGASPGGAGKMVIVRHDDGYMSIYSNAQELFVAMGERVEKGQAIAKLGANANDEPLLRFEISKNGNLLNPNEFLTPR